MESLFSFLFKYRPLLFERGDFELAAPWPVWTLIGVAALIGIPAVLTYAFARGAAARRHRVTLAVLRIGVFAVLAFCLLRPQLVVPSVVPQRSFVAVLIDDSRSMQVPDEGEEARTEFVARTFGAESELIKALSNRFRLRYYRFSSDVDRANGVADMTYTGRATRIGSAIDRVRDDMAGMPLSGLVVVTDGADNSRDGLAQSLLPMKASGVPVYTVGVGREELARDIQVTRVETPTHVLSGSSLVVDVVVSQTGYAGKKVNLNVEDAGRIVDQQEITLPDDGQPITVRTSFTATEPGARRFKFRVRPETDEVILDNNEQEAVIRVESGRQKVLYFEGEPRFELKFLRRAVADDPSLHVVALQRTAQNKYLRLDVDNASELETGFPTTREELFRYRALILGSVEASFFSHDQLQMISEFVSRRGGGLLVLGGRHSFGEGGWAGTPVDDVLPIGLTDGTPTRPFFAEVNVHPTRAGLSHPATQLADTEAAARERWGKLPPLTVVNAVYNAKPGATTLLTGTSNNREHVVLAYQRFGRGMSFALPVQDSWMWQMHADIPVDDVTHETFWRQLLRWVVSDVPDPVVASATPDRTSPEDPITIRAEVDDSAFMRVNDAKVVATVVQPNGESINVPLEWDVSADGEYRANFQPTQNGVHEIRVQAARGEASLGVATTYADVAESKAEYYDARMNAPALKRIAEETGGRFYTRSSVDKLAEDITYTGRGETITEEKDLWDMPIIFLLLVTLVGAEWAFRRTRGLA